MWTLWFQFEEEKNAAIYNGQTFFREKQCLSLERIWFFWILTQFLDNCSSITFCARNNCRSFVTGVPFNFPNKKYSGVTRAYWIGNINKSNHLRPDPYRISVMFLHIYWRSETNIYWHSHKSALLTASTDRALLRCAWNLNGIITNTIKTRERERERQNKQTNKHYDQSNLLRLHIVSHGNKWQIADSFPAFICYDYLFMTAAIEIQNKNSSVK